MVQKIISLSLVVMAGLIALSQYFAFKNEREDENQIFRYMILTFSLFASAVLSIGMVLSYGKTSCFIMYALDRFVKILIMGEIILLTREMMDVDQKYISRFLSLVSYVSVLMFFVDVFFDGTFERSPFGVYYVPKASWHLALYFFFYMFYVIMLISFIVYRGGSVTRRCQRYDMFLLLGVYILSASGFLAEQFIIAFTVTYIPLALFFNLAAAIVMRKLIAYHESIQIVPEHFANELDPSRTDIVFVMDDQFRIVLQNKRAEVLASMMQDRFVGRKLMEVFKFSDSAYSQLTVKPDEIPYGISAEYPKNDHHVNMIIHHKLDQYEEVLSTTVIVYNMEEFEKTEEIVEVREDDDAEMVENAVRVTNGARVLIVDEDVMFLNVFQRILNPFKVKVTRAVNGKEAINQVAENVFDLIFVSYEMGMMDGRETVRNIRNLNGEYYKQVPIVFITKSDINEVFTDFLEAGFNDYLLKPISKRSLNAVLTRWLWQRFDNDRSESAQQESTFDYGYDEMRVLLEDAGMMYKNQKYDKFLYCVVGIQRIGRILGLLELSDMASSLSEAIQFGDTKRTEQLFVRLTSGVRDAITIKG